MLARPLLTLLGLLLLAGYVLVADGSRLLAKEHDGQVGTRDCQANPSGNPMCVGNVSISGLTDFLTAGQNDRFYVNATNLVATTTYAYTLEVSVPSNSSIGFNSSCTSHSRTWMPHGSAVAMKAATMYGCRWSSNASITVTAKLRHSGELIQTATHGVTVVPTKPNPVGGLSVDEGNAKLTLTWSKPTWDGGANLTGYQVQNNEGTPGWPGGSSVINNPDTLRYTVQPLVNGTPYKVRVRACNAASKCSDWREGGGRPEDDTVPPPSTPTPTATVPPVVPPTQTPPGTVRNLMVEAAPGELRLTWNKPSSSGSADITGYHVQNKRATDTTWPTGSSVIDHDDYTNIDMQENLEFTVEPLINGTAYRVQVQACNAHGLCGDWVEGGGTPPEPGTTPPPATVPKRIRDLSVTVEEDGNLTLDWSAPLDGGSPIRRYEVQHKEASASWPPESQVTTVTSTEATISVTQGTKYKVRVRACNDIGCGEWSTSTTTGEQIITTPSLGTDVALTGTSCASVAAQSLSQPSSQPDTLAIPTGLEVIPYPGRRAALVWEEVAGAGGYVVQVKGLGEPRWLPPNRLPDEGHSGNTNKPCYEIKLGEITTFADDSHRGLAEVKAFEFRVKAAWWSDPMQVITTAPAVTSLASDQVMIIDTPITEADGDSRAHGSGKAELTWTPMDQVLNADFAGGLYRLRYRKSDGDYWASSWVPGTYDTDKLSFPVAALTPTQSPPSH